MRKKKKRKLAVPDPPPDNTRYVWCKTTKSRLGYGWHKVAKLDDKTARTVCGRKFARRPGHDLILVAHFQDTGPAEVHQCVTCKRSKRVQLTRPYL